MVLDPGLRRDDEGGRADERWTKAVARYARAEAGIEALAHSEDEDLYDRAVGRQIAALGRLLRAPAPDLAAAARKLDLIVRHQAWELTCGEAPFAALRRDLKGFAGGSRTEKELSYSPAFRS